MTEKAKMIFDALVITMPNESEINFVETILDGGKTDDTERASNICAYLNEEGKEKLIYDLLQSA